MSEYEAMLDGIEFGAERSWDYALDAAHDALDATAEKFGVKTDAGIMREFHAAIEALRDQGNRTCEADQSDGSRSAS